MNKETVSEEQVLFNKLNYEEQQFILKQMRLLQPCEIIEEKKIPDKLTPFEAPFLKNDEPDIRFRLIIDRINEICDYLKSKGE